MTSPYNEKDNATTRNLMPPSKTSSVKNGLHQVKLMAKGLSGTC